MSSTLSPLFVGACAMTALLTMSSREPLWSWERACAGRRSPQLWGVAIALAVAAGGLGIGHPNSLGAAAGEGFNVPAAFAVASDDR